jgi:hypothetical protein
MQAKACWGLASEYMIRTTPCVKIPCGLAGGFFILFKFGDTIRICIYDEICKAICQAETSSGWQRHAFSNYVRKCILT